MLIGVSVMAHSKCGAFTQGKGWRRTIGVKVGDGGRLMPCRVLWGMEKPRATATALQIESLWVGLDAPYWTADALAMAEAIRVGATAKNSADATATPKAVKASPTVKTILTVGGLIERYRQAKLADGSISDASKHSIRCRTKSLERSPIVHEPLASVGAEQLAALVSHWLAQPKTPKGEKISETSARLIVKTAKAVFDYADGVGLWTAPRRFDRIFRLPRTSSAPAIKTFSIGELVRLYSHAHDSLRLPILLALNCGFCSAELASLRKDEIDLQSKVIKRKRQKTAVEQSWKLWDETVKALQKGMAKEGDLALLTDGGKPIMFYGKSGCRIDMIIPRWARLLKRANKADDDGNSPPQISGTFKTLRKTGATMMRAIGGIEVSEIYLAHSEKTVAKFYSTPDHAQMTAALTTLRKQLAPMFASTAAKRAKGKIAA